MEYLKLACDKWSEQMLHDLSIMQKSGIMCDVKICLHGDTVLLTHSCVLAAASPFLRSILTGTEAPELDFRDFPSKIVQQIIEFMYTGEIFITKTDVFLLRSVASHLCIPALTAMLQHTGEVDGERAQECMTGENDSTKLDRTTELESKETSEGHKTDDISPLFMKDSITESEKVNDAAYLDHQEKSQKPDSISGEALPNLLVEEITNKTEIDLFEEYLHSKTLHTENVLDMRDSRVVHHCAGNGASASSSPEAGGAVEYHCPECNVGYTSDVHYYKHMHRKHGKALPVDIYITLERERKARLGQSVFENAEETDEKCEQDPTGSGRRGRKKYFTVREDLCDKRDAVSTVSSRNEGKQKSKDIFICVACRRGFKTISSLKLHETIHKDDRPFKCKLCNRAFTQAGNLRVHERSHTGEKPFQCSQCGLGFGQSGHLKSHMRIHTGEKPYTCTICGAAFGNSTNLESHRRRHTGEKPYKCTTCGKAFSQLGNLNTHQRCHAGIKPYQCSHCQKAFTALCNYQRHLKRHLVDRPFHCPECGKGFINNSEMRSHQRQKHMIIFDPDNLQQTGVHFPRKDRGNSVSLMSANVS